MQNKVNESLVCSICNKTLSSSERLKTHMVSCERKTDTQELSELRLRNIELEKEKAVLENAVSIMSSMCDSLAKRLENIALKTSMKPAVSMSNTISLNPLSQEHCDREAQNFNESYMYSVCNLVEYMCEYPCKETVAVSDLARRVFAWKDTHGNLIRDSQGTRLLQMICKSIKAKTDEYDKPHLRNSSENEAEFLRIRNCIAPISEGKDHEMKAEIASKLCKLVPRLKLARVDLDNEGP